MAFMKQQVAVVLVLCQGYVTRDVEYELMDKYRMFEIATANVKYVTESDLSRVSAIVAPDDVEIPAMFAHLPHPDELLKKHNASVSEAAKKVGGDAPIKNAFGK